MILQILQNELHARELLGLTQPAHQKSDKLVT